VSEGGGSRARSRAQAGWESRQLRYAIRERTCVRTVRAPRRRQWPPSPPSGALALAIRLRPRAIAAEELGVGGESEVVEVVEGGKRVTFSLARARSRRWGARGGLRAGSAIPTAKKAAAAPGERPRWPRAPLEKAVDSVGHGLTCGYDGGDGLAGEPRDGRGRPVEEGGKRGKGTFYLPSLVLARKASVLECAHVGGRKRGRKPAPLRSSYSYSSGLSFRARRAQIVISRRDKRVPRLAAPF